MRVQPGDTDAGVRRRAEKVASRSRSRDSSKLMLERGSRRHSESYLLRVPITLFSNRIAEICREFKLDACGGISLCKVLMTVYYAQVLFSLILYAREIRETHVKQQGILREAQAMYNGGIERGSRKGKFTVLRDY